MTAPANKRRIFNDAARAAELRFAGGGAERVRKLRATPRAARLAELRAKAADRT